MGNYFQIEVIRAIKCSVNRRFQVRLLHRHLEVLFLRLQFLENMYFFLRASVLIFTSELLTLCFVNFIIFLKLQFIFIL